MATKPLKTLGKKKQPSAVETSLSIENQIKSFLQAGGKIEQVNSGVSGQQSMMVQKPKPAPKPEPSEVSVSSEPSQPSEESESADVKESTS